MNRSKTVNVSLPTSSVGQIIHREKRKKNRCSTSVLAGAPDPLMMLTCYVSHTSYSDTPPCVDDALDMAFTQPSSNRYYMQLPCVPSRHHYERTTPTGATIALTVAKIISLSKRTAYVGCVQATKLLEV